MFKMTTFLSMLALAAFGWQQERPRSALPLAEEMMLLEYSVATGEVAVLVEGESDEQLERVRVHRPGGELLLELTAPAGRKRGLSGFAVELCEPGILAVVQGYPEGAYEIRARTVDGRLALGRAELSFDLPAAPQVVYPFPGASDVPTSGLTVRWLADRSVAGYHVQLEQDENDGLVVQLPAGSSSFRVPDGYLERGTATQLEVVATGRNGNRTVVEVPFTTR